MPHDGEAAKNSAVRSSSCLGALISPVGTPVPFIKDRDVALNCWQSFYRCCTSQLTP